MMLGTIFGVCLITSPIEMIFSRFIPALKKIITPLVSGIVVTLIGMSLIKVGITDIGGELYKITKQQEDFLSVYCQSSTYCNGTLYFMVDNDFLSAEKRRRLGEPASEQYIIHFVGADFGPITPDDVVRNGIGWFYKKDLEK